MTKTLENVTMYLYPTYKPMLRFKLLLLETPPHPAPLAVWTCCICFSDETLCPVLPCPVPLAPSGGHAATADAFGPHCSLRPPSGFGSPGTSNPPAPSGPVLPGTWNPPVPSGPVWLLLVRAIFLKLLSPFFLTTTKSIASQ